jgi:hypothetical protein
MKLLNWWRALRSAVMTPIPYTVACRCGHLVQGLRQPRHQVVSCPRCRQLVFVLSRSPFQGDRRSSASQSVTAAAGSLPAQAASSGQRSRWVIPLAAALLTLAALVAGFLALTSYLSRPAKHEFDPAEVRTHLQNGRQALADGFFERAQKELARAVALTDEHPQALSLAEVRDLHQLYQQSDLLALLSSQSLQEILQQAIGARSDDEWQARFRKEYQGKKTILFDDLVQVDPKKEKPVLVVQVFKVSGVKVRVALEDLKVLRNLPLATPQRLVFGARLTRIDREDGGGWVVGFEPDSGVLLTDEDAFRACAPALVEQEPEVRDVLKRQKEWLREPRAAGQQ